MTKSVIGGQWQDWTPTLTNLTLGNGTQVARYCQIGGTVHFFWSFTLGSTSAVGTGPYFSLPVEAANANASFTARYLDAGTAWYQGQFWLNSTTTCQATGPAHTSGTHTTDGGVQATVPFTWTTNDGIYTNGTYEAA